MVRGMVLVVEVLMHVGPKLAMVLHDLLELRVPTGHSHKVGEHVGPGP